MKVFEKILKESFDREWSDDFENIVERSYLEIEKSNKFNSIDDILYKVSSIVRKKYGPKKMESMGFGPDLNNKVGQDNLERKILSIIKIFLS